MSHAPDTAAPRPPLRLGLVGCGRLAELGYVPAVAATPGVELVAVADPDTARAAAVASKAGAEVSVHPDAVSLLRSVDLDGVVLASPVDAHVPDARMAADAGLAVLVEKPPARDAAGAAVLERLGPHVRLGFNRRFDPGARQVKDAVPADGRVELACSIAYRRASWAAHTVRDGVLLDLVPHLVDWVRWISGAEIAEVTAGQLTHDQVELDLVLADDRGTARVVAGAGWFHEEQIEARLGDDRIVDHRVGGPFAAVTGRLLPSRRPHPLSASLAAQLEAFADAARGGPAPDLGTAADGVAVMSVIDAARSSSAAGRVPVAVVSSPEELPPC